MKSSAPIFFSSRGLNRDSLVYAWKINGYTDEWNVMPFNFFDEKMKMVHLSDLKPGHYTFRSKAGTTKGSWLKNEVLLKIAIAPAYWQTWWFWAFVIVGFASTLYIVVKWRVNTARKQERVKARYEKELLELEAKALRAQMNPHFIFNCLNSIKALIGQKDEDKAITYLSTFSKLIRTIFQNSDKRNVSLHDEIETCRLYAELECMRFGNKITNAFFIQEEIDLKSIFVPALIVQPFIENAIWHGVIPKEEGGYVHIFVRRELENILCIVDDDGIGRRASKQNKFNGELSRHQAKGFQLTQSRLDLDNALNENNATVEIIDKKDETGKAAGTKVVLNFKEY